MLVRLNAANDRPLLPALLAGEPKAVQIAEFQKLYLFTRGKPAKSAEKMPSFRDFLEQFSCFAPSLKASWNFFFPARTSKELEHGDRPKTRSAKWCR
jgi:hypothetical protein